MSLERFHRAQASNWSGFAMALNEIQRGRKSSHWIWYVFPQIDGLGRSGTAQEYALHGLGEAVQYVRDPILRTRYLEIARGVEEQLARGVTLEHLMGGQTDALKLVSSLTLFRAAAEQTVATESDPAFGQLAQVINSLLQQTAVQGYPPCELTLNRITATK